VAVVGDAYIVVRAITDRVKDDIRDGFRGADREGERAGKDVGDGLDRGFKRSAGNRDGMFRNLQRNAEAAREKFNRLIQIGYILGPAFAGAAAALGGVGAGLFAIGAQAAAAGPALLSLLNILTAVAQAALVLKAVFGGVGAAIGAGLKGSSGGGGGGSGNAAANLARQIERANERIEDAKKRLAQVINENSKRIEQAQKNIERASRAVADAQYDAIKAGEAVVEAENDLQKAYDATSRARKEAAEDIQQLKFALEDSVLSEERAAINLEKAREKLAKVQNLPPNNRERREAELAFKEADLRLRQAIDKRQDTAEKVDEANAKGVEGSDKVVAALERERKAAKSIDDAKRSAFLANRDLNDALEAEADARNELNAVIAENASRLEEAEKAVKDAIKDLDELRKSATGAAGGGGGGLDAFAAAMAKLSPKAQEFVRIILDIVEAFKPIKLAAQDAFFGNFNDAVKELADVYLPVLEKKLPVTAGLLGEIGANILRVVSNTENVKRVERIWDSNDKIIGSLGKALENLVDIFIILLDNLRPLAEEFAGWIETVTTGWRETITLKDKNGELKKSFEDSAAVVRQLGRIFGNLFRSIMNLGKAAAGPGSGGQMLFDLLENLTAKWLEFTGSTEGQNKLEQYFRDIVPIVSEVGGLIGDIFGAFFRLAGETADETSSFFTSLRNVVGIFEEMGGAIASALPIAGEFLEKSAEAINNLTSSGAIDAFFTVLKEAATVIADITGSPIFQKIFAVVAPIFAISRGLGLVLKFLKFIFLGSIVGNIFKFSKLFDGLKAVITFLRYPIISTKLAFLSLGKSFGFLAVAANPVTLAIAAVVAVIIAMWTQSEIFREAVKKLISSVLEKLVEIFNDLKQRLDDALEPLGGMSGLLETLGGVFEWLGDLVGTYVIPILEIGLLNAFTVIGEVIGTVIDLIGNIIKTFSEVFDAIGKGDWATAGKKLFEGLFINPLKIIGNNLLNLAKNILGNVIKVFQREFSESVFGKIVLGAMNGLNTLYTKIQELWNNIINWIKNFLGIASPSKLFQSIGDAIVNGISIALQALLNVFLTPFKLAWEAVKFLIDGVFMTFWNNLPGRIKEAIKSIFEPFLTNIKNAWDSTKNYIDNTLMPFITGLPAKFATKLRDLWNAVKDQFTDQVTKVKTKVTEFITYIGTFVTKMKSALSKLWDPIIDGLKAAWGAAKAWWNSNVAGRGFSIGGSFGIPKIEIKIPALAEGGVVPATRGGMLAIVGEGGRAERVEPLDENGLSKRDKALINYLTGGGGGGTTINVYPSAGMDERELAQKVSRELALQVRRGAL